MLRGRESGVPATQFEAVPQVVLVEAGDHGVMKYTLLPSKQMPT